MLPLPNSDRIVTLQEARNLFIFSFLCKAEALRAWLRSVEGCVPLLHSLFQLYCLLAPVCLHASWKSFLIPALVYRAVIGKVAAG